MRDLADLRRQKEPIQAVRPSDLDASALEVFWVGPGLDGGIWEQLRFPQQELESRHPGARWVIDSTIFNHRSSFLLLFSFTAVLLVQTDSWCSSSRQPTRSWNTTIYLFSIHLTGNSTKRTIYSVPADRNKTHFTQQPGQIFFMRHSFYFLVNQ